MSLGSNDLSGTIPSELGNLLNLGVLKLSSNNLSGTIPKELSKLSNLQILELDRNNLEGSIPPEFGNLNKLNWLFLEYNNLSGPIPAEFGQLTNLEWLTLSNNSLSGTIPLELGALNQLNRLYINDNQLEGCFATELQTYCDLYEQVNSHQIGYNFTNNSGLSWQGNFKRFCDGEQQPGTSCENGIELISPDCTCRDAVTNIGTIAAASFEVFPNPATSTVHFRVQEDMDLSQISCTDISGQEVSIHVSILGDLITLDLNKKNAGLYFLSIKGKEKVYVTKVVKSL